MAQKKSKKESQLIPVGVDLEAVLKLMDRYELAELEWERGGEKLRLRSKAWGAAFAGTAGLGLGAASDFSQATLGIPMAPVKSAQDSSVAPAVTSTSPAPSPGRPVNSPLVGTFYRSPSPTAKPYVEVGQRVEKGQTLCIVEAMKLMNEIEAEVAGKVTAILIENGQPVEFGEALFLIEPSH